MKLRKRNLYDPKKPYKLSRSKIDAYIDCPRCFYLDRKLGLGSPPSFPLTLNMAVDVLLKKEFDLYRAKGEPHPLMAKHGIDAVLYNHPDLNIWRNNRKGIEYHDESTNFTLTGAIDDVWMAPQNELIIPEYKSTSKSDAITMDSYAGVIFKRQLEFYQWLFRQKGFEVLSRAYIVYANGRKDRPNLGGKLEFDMQIFELDCDDSWVEPTIKQAHACLKSNKLPAAGEDCSLCAYRALASDIEG